MLFRSETHQAPINILSMDEFFSESFDVLVNIDSFPEIDTVWANKYLKHMDTSVKWFYSFNQETMRDDQIHIPSSIWNNTALQVVDRNRSFFRRGYIEELYYNPKKINS